MRITVDHDGARIGGTERELTDLASAILEAAVLGSIEEHVLTEQGVSTIRIQRTDDVDPD